MFLTKSKVIIHLLSNILKQLIHKLGSSRDHLMKVKTQVKSKLEGQKLSDDDTEHFSALKHYITRFSDEIGTRILELEDMWRIIEDKEGGYCHLSTLS